MTRKKNLTRLMSIFFQFPSQEFVSIYWSAYHRKVTCDIVSHGVLDEKFRFLNFATYKHFSIWLISVRDLKGLLFLHEPLSPLKIFLFQCFLLVPGLDKIYFTPETVLQWMKRKWYMYKKVYWIIGINIYESRIVRNAAVHSWFWSSQHT